jgi:hypothetical protein
VNPVKSPDVFISYSHADSVWVRRFSDALRESGVTAWLDVDEISPGEDLRTALEEALRSSEAVAFVLSHSTPASSPSLLFEIGAAIGMNKRLLPIVEPGLSSSDVPLDLRHRRWIVRREPAETAREVAAALARALPPAAAAT